MLNRVDPPPHADPGFFTTPRPTVGTWVRGGVSDWPLGGSTPRSMHWRAPDRKQASARGDRYHRGMRLTLVVLGLLLVLAGLVWMAQGLNLPFAPRSFMTADRSWLIIGALTTVAGAVMVGWARRHHSPG